MTSPHRRTCRLLALVAAVPLLLTGCSGGEEADAQTAEERLEAARTVFDETSGVRLGLAAPRLPDGVNGLLSAQGVATHDPAFEGSIKVVSGGLTADVDVVAVDGAVHAKLPFRSGFTEVDPADYSAPDPADLMSTEDGLSSLLTAAEEVEEGDQVRDGGTVLSKFTGTLSGDVVSSIIPSASPEGRFDATFTLDDSDQVDQIVLTGPFYPDAEDITYTIEVDEYGVEQDIRAP
jgi:lipoprotein LprG